MYKVKHITTHKESNKIQTAKEAGEFQTQYKLKTDLF